ncbi:amino acid racemase [Nonomuraea basaltis]|nr:amino acid racemase [Nonomuraea basaltis]
MNEKTDVIGLLGGMSWESTATYYRALNTLAAQRLGGHHNARSLLYSFDYDELLTWGSAGEWDKVTSALVAAARMLEDSGVAFVLLTANTAHVAADAVEAALRVPLLHIADPTGQAITELGLTRVGLIGTRFAMELEFLTGRLKYRHGLDVRVPAANDRDRLHTIIVDELTLGEISADSRTAVLDIAQRLVDDGAEGIIIGCTELPLLLEDKDYPVPAFDTTKLHVAAAIDLSLGSPPAAHQPRTARRRVISTPGTDPGQD